MPSIDLQKEKVSNFAFEYLLKLINHNQDFLNRPLWLGIGSGSTIKFFIKKLGNSFKNKSFPCLFYTVSSSTDSEVLCRDLDLPIKQLADLPEGRKLDFYIDGADEVDSSKRCLKGLGGASTREKFIRIESNKFFVLVDESKKVTHLCKKQPIVCEIIPFGFEKTLERIKQISPTPSNVVMRKGNGKMGFVITDNNNYLVDVYFKNEFEPDFAFELFERNLRAVPGVVETGLFGSPADVVFIGSDADIEVLT